MRRIRYSVAISLDGYIAGLGDEFDWIVMDPDIDFARLSEQFDTYLLGRRTFEVTRSHGQAAIPGARTYVFSRTLRQSDYDDVTIVSENWRQVVQSLCEEEGKDIWLFGGGCPVSQPSRRGIRRHGGGRYHPNRARRRYSAHCRTVHANRADVEGAHGV